MSTQASTGASRGTMPARLGRYEVRAKIGDGGMATVYVGRLAGPPGFERRFERVVALKVIKEEYCRHPEFVTMFLDEANIIARLSHPNCVQVIELGTEGDRLFIAMELLLGRSLWDVWDACRARNVRLRYDLAAWIGARVAEGLHHAHEMKDASGQPQQLVHRDVNASNIILTYEGHVKVIDFGLAKARNRAYKTAAGVVKGKLAYLSPEQISGGTVDRRADVFALGTTLWELTTDRRLFRVKDDAETLKRVFDCNVPDPTTFVEGYPPGLWEILKRALARDPATRYATAADLARSLDEYARNEGRTVDAMELAGVMKELFSVERERDQHWFEDASAADRPAPVDTLHPPPPNKMTHPPPPEPAIAEASLVAPAVPADLAPPSTSWPNGAPPDGMFSPAPVRPPGGPPALEKDSTKIATPVGAMEPPPIHAVPRPRDPARDAPTMPPQRIEPARDSSAPATASPSRNVALILAIVATALAAILAMALIAR